MKFGTLHENLRQEILRRIDRGLLTGATLARATGFQQAHISNFLNCKRSLSLEGLDRVLASQNISVFDLLPADAIPALPIRNSSGSLTQTIPVVTHSSAALKARIQPAEILEMIEVPDAALHFFRERLSGGKSLWQRFVAIRINGLQAAAMDPLLKPDSIVVLDRHYNSLAMYRSQSPTLYAVHINEALHLGFLELDANMLILRPRNQNVPVRLIELSKNEQPGEQIVGRICYALSEF